MIPGSEVSKIILAVDTITLVLGLPANLLAFYIFCRKLKQNGKPIDVLLLSLTISDLIFLFLLPFRMKEAIDVEWKMSDFFCPLSNFIFYTTIYSSTFLLTAISVERYLGVAFPIRYKLKRQVRGAVVASVVFCLVCMAHCSVIFFVEYSYSNTTNGLQPKRNTCYEEFTNEQLSVLLPVRLEMFVVLFCVPFTICCFCYISFIRILSRLPNINPKKRFRAIGLSLFTLLVFIICFLPFNVSHVEGYITWTNPEWRHTALLTSTLNACLDPFIFYFSSAAVRGTLNNLIQRLVRRMNSSGCCPNVNCTSVEETTQSSTNTLH
ncbi:free fatty acid receptor 3-like [Brachyhypopomus gauderio]|uniref:free fatty acid receptor 3-like n=1 Tax=Brachyhypopomus gauderio TaxID=698409 RepID=UPI0040434839